MQQGKKAAKDKTWRIRNITDEISWTWLCRGHVKKENKTLSLTVKKQMHQGKLQENEG